MTKNDKSQEDRQRLQRLIDSDRSIVLALERCPLRRVNQVYCDGAPFLWAQSLDKSRAEIKDDFRIVVSPIEGQAKYYHVSCLEEIIDLSPLAPHRFKLDTSLKRWNGDFPDTWGLLLRDWFESSGRIDLAKFASCIDLYLKRKAESQKEISECDSKSKSQSKNKAKSSKKKSSEASGPNSTEVKAYKQPKLKDYQSTREHTCTLDQVLQHPYLEYFQLWSLRQLEGLED